MASFRHGRDGYLAIVIGGSTTTLSTTFDDSALQRTVDTAEVTAFGDDDRVYLAGLRTGTIPVSGHFSTAAEATLAGQLGSTTLPTFIYGPQGSASGNRKYTAAGTITSLNVQGSVGDKVSMDFGVQLSSAITSTTFA